MKESIKLFCITAILLLIVSNTYSTPLNGTYTIGSGGNYPTINSAVSDLVSSGINGDVVFNILTGFYSEHIVINSVPGTASGYTVTFKSLTGNPNDVIISNSSKGDNDNIVIDGTDNLSIESFTFSNAEETSSRGIIHFLNDCHNIKILNNIFPNESGAYTMYNIYGFGGFDLSNLLIKDNSFLSESYCHINIYPSDIDISNIKVINNNFINSSISVLVQKSDSVLIEKNNILCRGEYPALALWQSKTINVSKNNIRSNIKAIEIVNCGNMITRSLISNNFIYTTSHAVTNIISNGYNILFINNTIKASNLDTYSNYKSITFFSCTNIKLYNNLFISGRGCSLCIDQSTINSDHNDINNDENPGLIEYNELFYDNISDYIIASGLDQHSNSHPVTFLSPTDLHLAGSSVGDEQLAGIPDALVPDDFDGQPRNPLHPYKGADEVSDFPLPVELASFTSSVNNNNVNLKWTTASETNNSGFDVERAIENGQLTIENWSKAGYVEGSGTTNEQREYTFTDRNLPSGKYKYRLKQIDFNGNFEYHNLSDEVVIGVPDKFELSQNYPNPFNPSTHLEFGISDLEFVSLKVYNSLGKEVAVLVNEIKPAGRYEVEFDGSNLGSGVYYYKLSAGNFVSVKKMMLLK